MNLFGLDAPSIMARVRASPGGSKPPLLPKSLAIGMLGFGAASLVVFGMWAFAGRAMYRYFGEAGAYAVWAIMFVALAGGVLNPLVIGPRTLGRFYGLFTLAFGAYALWWSLSWFVLKDRAGEWVGSLLGSVALGWILTWGFAARGVRLRVIAALFVLHTAGYFLGSFLFAFCIGQSGAEFFGESLSKAGRSTLAKFLWGAAYGAGLGAGLGYALYVCQREVRGALAMPVTPALADADGSQATAGMP